MSIVDDLERELLASIEHAARRTREEYAANGASNRYYRQIRALMDTRHEINGGRLCDPFAPIFKAEVDHGI